MNQQFQITSIIRQRGQLTIPDLIRERVDWVTLRVEVKTEGKQERLFVLSHS